MNISHRASQPIDSILAITSSALVLLAMMAITEFLSQPVMAQGLPSTVRGDIGLLAGGKHQVRMEFGYDGGGIGKGVNVTLYVDGKPVGNGRVDRTHALFFSLDETLEIGCDAGETVSDDYGLRDNNFNGTVNWVQIDIDKAAADKDHLIAPEERSMVAMTRQ
jgi:hypothetical protein